MVFADRVRRSGSTPEVSTSSGQTFTPGDKSAQCSLAHLIEAPRLEILSPAINDTALGRHRDEGARSRLPCRGLGDTES